MAVAPVLGLAATGLSAAGSIVGAQGQEKANEFEAQQAINAAQYGRTKAAQTGTELTRNMQATLGHIAAVRASVGSDVRSPTTAAIMENQERKMEWDRGIQIGNIENQVQSDVLSSQMYTSMAG